MNFINTFNNLSCDIKNYIQQINKINSKFYNNISYYHHQKIHHQMNPYN